jgi:hypothetical protein
MSSQLQNIPPLWNAFAYWLACMLYLRELPQRFVRSWRTVTLSLALLVGMILYMAGIEPLSGWFNLAMCGFALLTTVPFLCLTTAPLTTRLYCCAIAFILGGFASSLAWQLYIYSAQRLEFMDCDLAEAVTILVIYAMVHVIMSLIDRRHQDLLRELSISKLSCASVMLIAFLTYVLSSLSFTTADTPFSASTYAEAFNVRTLVYLGGLAILYAHHVQLCQTYITLERDTLQNMLNMQYANYILSQESVDMVNRKYHDLKHQISILRSEVGAEQKLDYLDRMEREIQVYEAQNKTGNQFLDTILTSKGIHCQKAGINLTCVADGAALDFMDVMDLSALFGNALDNAIEAVSPLPKEQRLIHLSVCREKGFLRIRLENRCQNGIKIKNGVPVTTKRDKRYHGFGVKSIFATAEKYGGSATVQTQNGWFELRVLIPLEGRAT